jgi:hypothetical protein
MHSEKEDYNPLAERVYVFVYSMALHEGGIHKCLLNKGNL